MRRLDIICGAGLQACAYVFAQAWRPALRKPGRLPNR